MPEKLKRTLSDQEMIEIAEEIARDSSNAAAQMAAIRLLRDITRSEEPIKREGDVMEAPPRKAAHLRSV